MPNFRGIFGGFANCICVVVKCSRALVRKGPVTRKHKKPPPLRAAAGKLQEEPAG